MELQHNYKLKDSSRSITTAEEQYTALMDSMGISAHRIILDQDLTVLYANSSYLESSGYSKVEFVTHFPTLRLYYTDYPEDFNRIRSALTSALSSGESRYSVDCRVPVKSGLYFWARINGTITDKTVDGCPVFTAFYSNISDLVRLTEEKDQYFHLVMDEYVGNIYISDMDTYELLYLNKESCQTLHAPKGQLLGRKCYEVIQGRTSPCPFCTNHYLTTDEFYEWEFFNPVLDRTFMIKNRVINWNGHKARIEMSHDMYSAEYKLAKKDREREALLRTIPGGFVRVDARDFDSVLWYGADFLEVIGYTKKQFEEELHCRCNYIHPEDKERIQGMMKEILNTRESIALEVRVITHSGESRILTATLCYVSGEDSWDSIPSFYSMGIDVTNERMEQSRQRRALEEAYQTARVASSAKSNFLSMSHDIRTPMNAIMGMSAIAQAHLTSPDRVRDCLSKINVSSRHLLSLINEVLDMSKIESGKIDLLPEEVSLPDMLQNISVMCRPLANEKHQEFQINVGPVRHEKIIADGDRLQQVFMNLLSNAIKYTPDRGTIILTINENPSMSGRKGAYEFTFQDNGIGMSEEYIPHIFEPFSRAEDSRISKIQGTGLGMAITENIIHMMNGSIQVSSRPGCGSCFTVSVQFEYVDEENVCEDELEGLPVLVVDDDQIVCENAAALLNELGMRGYWVLSGAEAVDSVEEAHDSGDDFFAVILDWKMPEMDGLETVKAIRRRLNDDVPIIIISAYDYSNIEGEFLRAGADAFITKPLFKSKMLHVLQLFCTVRQNDTEIDRPKSEKTPLIGRRVLLAEDNELNREIAIELLQMQGLMVDAAENGQLAVDAFRASSPGYYAAILMDIQMPVMNGHEAIAAIRSLEREDGRTIPIFALTANAFTTDVGKSRSVGMNDHIPKPIDMDHLMNVLLKWIK